MWRLSRFLEDSMKGQNIALVLLIFTFTVSPAEASDMLYNPQFCYILDVFLLAYGIIITALYLREKCCKPKEKTQKGSDYEELRGQRATYDGLNKRDVESGRARGPRRRMDDDTYTPLQNKTDDTYRQIQVKKDRRPNDQVYQGLSSATKDTYDQLNMQPLPPRR